MSDNSSFGDKKIIFRSKKKIFLLPQNELSDVNKTYVHISNGQKFELLRTDWNIEILLTKFYIKSY